MRIAFTSCWHLQPGDTNTPCNYRTQLYWVDKALQQMKDNGVEAVMHCGDMFHYGRVGNRRVPTSAIVDELRQVVLKHDLPMFIVEGNHDQNDYPYPSAIRLLDETPRICHVGKMPYFTIPFNHLRLRRCASPDNTVFLPFDWYPGISTKAWLMETEFRIKAIRQKFGEDAQIIAFGHLDIADHSHGPGDWPCPTRADLFGLGDGIAWFTGHLHTSRVFYNKSFSSHVCVGALIRTRWDERTNGDGWFSFDTDTSLLVDYELEGPRFQEFIDTSPTRLGDHYRLPHDTPEAIIASLRGLCDVELMSPPPDRSKPAVKLVEGLHVGLTPTEAFRVWLGEDTNASVMQDCLQELKEVGVEVGPEDPGKGVRMRQINHVTLQNHIAFKDTKTVDFSPGWNTMLGPSGSGKTTILESVFTALFGYWPTKARDLWSGCTKFPAHVSANVHTIDGKEVVVTRGKPDLTHTYANVFEDGNKLDATQPTKVQAHICSLVGNDLAWLRSCFLSQDPQVDLVESTPTERMNAVQRLLGIDQMTEIHKRACERMKMVKRELQQREKTLDEYNRLYTEYQSCGVNITQTQAAVAHNKELVADLQAMVDKYTAREAASLLFSQIATVKAELAVLPYSNLEELEEQLLAMQRNYAAVTKLKDQIRLLNHTRKLGEEASAMLCNVGCASKLLDCPLITNAREQASAGAKADQAITELQESNILLLRAGDNTDYPAAIRDQSAAVNQARNDEMGKAFLTKRLSELEASIPEGVTRLDETAAKELGVLRGRLTAQTEEGIRFKVALANMEGANTVRQADLEKLWGELEASEKWVNIEIALSLVVEAFSRGGIPKQMISQAIPGIQAEITSILNRPGLGWLRLELDFPDPDNPKSVPTVTASSRGKAWVDARRLSGGERATARLVVRLAACAWFAKTTGSTILVLDEPTAHVSEDISNALVSVLRSMVGPGKPFHQGLLSTHDEVLAAALGNVRRF